MQTEEKETRNLIKIAFHTKGNRLLLNVQLKKNRFVNPTHISWT